MLNHVNTRESTPSIDDASTIIVAMPEKRYGNKREKDVFVEIEVSRTNTMASTSSEGQADAFPDGGLRAWLVVIGVRIGLILDHVLAPRLTALVLLTGWVWPVHYIWPLQLLGSELFYFSQITSALTFRQVFQAYYELTLLTDRTASEM